MAIVKQVKVASLDGLVVDGMSQIQRVMGEFYQQNEKEPSLLISTFKFCSTDSRFRQAIDSYLSKLEGSKVQTLDQLMQFMRDNAEQEMPPGMVLPPHLIGGVFSDDY